MGKKDFVCLKGTEKYLKPERGEQGAKGLGGH